MLFHVQMTVRIPPGTDPGTRPVLNEREHERAKELQLKGKWPHLWRVAGQVPEHQRLRRRQPPAELHEILLPLPLYQYMDVEVTALCHHPGSIEPER